MSEIVSTTVVKSGRKELISSEGVQAWLDDVSSGEGLFTSVVERQKSSGLSAYKDRNLKWAYATGVSLVGVGFGAIPLFMIQDTGLAVLSDLTIIAGFFFGSVPLTMKLSKKKIALLDQVIKVQGMGLKLWLKARYGLQVTLWVLEEVAECTVLGKAVAFEDVSGKSWAVEYSGGSFAVIPHETVVDREARVVEPLAFVVEVELPGEAGSLLAGIRSRVNALKTFTLNVESSHSVKRVEEDVRQAVESFRKLERLGVADSGVQALVSVLSALNDELRGLVDSEAEAVKADLMVQGDYVRSRQLEAGAVPGLSLSTPVGGSIVKVESANV